MWLVESDLFDGRKLWLRPGKRYLFGRTVSEAGQLAISDKTVSRKHVVIQVDTVPEGDARNINSRSNVTIEDMEAKKGTLLNGVQIRGKTKTLTEPVNEVKLGLCPKLLRIVWQPIVLSFSFTSKELRADPWTTLRDSLEQLDIKFSAEYEEQTTHVVSKKRNTSKGLQALINGKYIVTDSFISAVVDAAAVPEGEGQGTSSALELDFDGSWPNALEHLPPRGEEPSDRPVESYAPDSRRRDVFEGYTFVFYEKKQYENLFPAITHGKGKALLKEVIPGETNVEDFIRYVKGVAGEKGLGSFEDGSEGRGVVVVRYMPSKGPDTEWFTEFLTSFARRLDHRPIDQREFLEAILACDASMLRRPLEVASQVEPAPAQNQEITGGTLDQMEIDRPQAQAPQQEQAQEPAPPQRRGRARRGATSRFKGFDIGSDDDDVTPAPAPAPAAQPEPEPERESVQAPAAASQDSLFVSQHQGLELERIQEEEQELRPARKSQRKRALSPLPEHDNSTFMDAIAPTAAAAKRRRIEAGQPAIPPPHAEPEAMEEDEEPVPESPPSKNGKKQGTKGRGKGPEGDDILELARRRREEEEARAAAEREKLATMDDDEIDYAAIRALHIIEECEVHFPDPEVDKNSRDQAIVDGRWDPRWNGRKNFKRFRKQGEPATRQAPRIIVGLEEVKPKEYGIGDDYWLEDEGTSSRQKKDSQAQSQRQTQNEDSAGKDVEMRPPPATTRRTILAIDSSDEEEQDRSADIEELEPPRSKVAKVAEKANTRRSQQSTQTQSQSTTTTRGSKRTAAAPAAKEPAAKKPRRGLRAKDSDESEGDSDDGLRFRFGKRK
ncbi:hypothetical protein V8F20_009446 [Naviculisporaceae sp. PSN 640]